MWGVGLGSDVTCGPCGRQRCWVGGCARRGGGASALGGGGGLQKTDRWGGFLPTWGKKKPPNKKTGPRMLAPRFLPKAPPTHPAGKADRYPPPPPAPAKSIYGGSDYRQTHVLVEERQERGLGVGCRERWFSGCVSLLRGASGRGLKKTVLLGGGWACVCVVVGGRCWGGAVVVAKS